MRPGVLLALALTSAALLLADAVPASALPPDPQAKQAKGKPKKPKPPKKKHAHVQAPKPVAEEAPVVRPLVEVGEPTRVGGAAASGVGITASRRDDLSSVALVLRIPFGAGDDPASQAGAAHVVLAAVERAVSPELRGLRAAGGEASFAVEPDASLVRVRVPSGSLDAALDLVAACLDRAVSSDDVVAAKASLSVSGTAKQRAGAELLRLAFQGYFPYEHGPLGTDASRAALDPKLVQGLREARFAGATLGIVGPGDAQAMVDAAKARLAGEARARATVKRTGELQEQTNQRATDLEEAAAPASLSYAWAIRGATEAELAALEIAAELLARGAIVEGLGKQSLAAVVRARVERREGVALLVVEVDLPDDAPMKKARHGVEDVLLAMSTKAAAAMELVHAREARWVDVVATLDDPLALAAWLTSGAGTFEARRSLLEAVTAEGVRAACAKFLGPLTRSVVELHDPARAPKQEKRK